LTVWSKSPRFTLNLTLFNRLALHPQVDEIIGDFTSLTLLEVDNAMPGTFKVRAQRLQERLWADLDHRYVSGVEVVRKLARMHGQSPRAMMPVVFTSTLHQQQDTSMSLDQDMTGPHAGSEDLGDDPYGISQTPQVWLDHQVSEQGGALVFNWDAVEDL
jgi:non-ribosomal peptide synthetase component F